MTISRRATAASGKFGAWARTTAAVLVAAAGAACTSDEHEPLTGTGRVLTADAFVGDATTRPTMSASDDATPRTTSTFESRELRSPVVDIGSPRSAAPSLADPGAAHSGAPTATRAIAPASIPSQAPAPGTLITTIGSPQTPRDDAPVVESVLVESLVGQINGRPVYASEILEPLDGRLRQAGTQAKTVAAWRKDAAEAIVRELNAKIENELVLAEARRTLTPEQKQGLFRFLQQVQANLISGQRGSEIAADEALRESTGRGLREQAESELDKALINKELRDRVGSRIVVSWRDIQQAYERDHEKYNPPAVAKVRLISVANKDTPGIAAVTQALAEGKPFAQVAEMEPNLFVRSEGGLLERKVTGAMSEGEFSPNPEVNAAIRSLNVGQVVGPFNYNPRPVDPEAKNVPAPDPSTFRTAWVYLESVDRPDGVSIYDAQLDIEQRLKAQRTNQEVGHYIDQLRSRGNISRVEIMAERLMTIATDRYASKFKGS